MIKLIAIDLDGTFLTDKKEVLERNVDALRQAIAKGIKIVICTGRTLPGVRRFLAKMPIFEQGDYLILQNGAATHAFPNLELVRQDLVTRQIKEQTLMVVDPFRCEGVQLVAFDQEHLYLIGERVPSNLVEFDSKTLETPITPLSIEDFLQHEGLNKIMALGEKEALDRMQQYLSQEVYEAASVVRSQPVIIEFLPKGVTKRSGLEQLTAQLGIDRTQVMAIGDQLNDLEMLEFAGVSVAMGNGVPLIKEMATYITTTNNEAGVAHIIEQVILKETE